MVSYYNIMHTANSIWLPVWVQTLSVPVKPCFAMVINKVQTQSSPGLKETIW